MRTCFSALGVLGLALHFCPKTDPTLLAPPAGGDGNLPGGLAASSSADEVRSRTTGFSVTWRGGQVCPDDPDAPRLGASFFFMDVRQGAATFSAKVSVQQKNMGSNDPTHSQPQHGHTASGPVCTAHATGHPTRSKLCCPSGRCCIRLKETLAGPVLPVSLHQPVHIT